MSSTCRRSHWTSLACSPRPGSCGPSSSRRRISSASGKRPQLGEVVGGDLGAVALGGFADVGDAVAQVGRARGELLALALDLRRRVDLGLPASARGGDVELLLVHRGIGGEEGAIDGGALGGVGGDGVGVLKGGGVAVGAGEVVGAEQDGALLVDAAQEDGALGRRRPGPLPSARGCRSAWRWSLTRVMT